MAIVTKGVFTWIDNTVMHSLTKTMDSTITHRYCALAAQLYRTLQTIQYIYGNIMSVL
ncbi:MULTISPECIES: hypothetical protein [unclassified Bartonella]|uniref:hypothetical protein n=1 Tax=unclassified Bartonella TaxID=2645622 RepID=UPI0035CF9F03